MFESFRKSLSLFSVFTGRTTKKDFWWFMLASFIFSMFFAFVDSLCDSNIFLIIFQIFIFLPSLAITVRRLHDINKSGVMIFISLIPFIGIIWLLALLASSGTPGSNNYGVEPGDLVEESNQQNVELPNVTTKGDASIPDICPHCKNPNTKRAQTCEWCGSKTC